MGIITSGPNFQANHGEIRFFCFLTIKSLNNNIKRILGAHTGRSMSASILEPCSMTSYPLFCHLLKVRYLILCTATAKHSIFSNTSVFISFGRLVLNFHVGKNTIKTVL